GQPDQGFEVALPQLASSHLVAGAQRVDPARDRPLILGRHLTLPRPTWGRTGRWRRMPPRAGAGKSAAPATRNVSDPGRGSSPIPAKSYGRVLSALLPTRSSLVPRGRGSTSCRPFELPRERRSLGLKSDTHSAATPIRPKREGVDQSRP